MENGGFGSIMANIASPLTYITEREYGFLHNLKGQLFNKRLDAAKNLYRRDLICHFGCVNAIEFSGNGELLVSGGDDRRVMLWPFGKAILDYDKPEPMKAMHQSNIFCLGITSDSKKIYSGGNDDIVIVHDLERKHPLEVLRHQEAVCSLSIDPFNECVLTTAGNDGRLLVFDTRRSDHESLVISRSRKAFHGVMFHPQQLGVLVSANARDGVALWDLRSTKNPVIRYVGNNGSCQNSMSVRFNRTGTHILALRRRLAPVLYSLHSPEPVAEFYHQDYYNSCTMKSCCFAGDNDQFVLSGSDDFNLYMWKVPDTGGGFDTVVEAPHIVLYGHRSIVNQVRYNSHYCLIASSGVEKIIKIWSPLEYPKMRGALLEEAQGSDNPREIYSHEDYVSLVHHSGQYLSHNYAEQSTSEDPRMMAFFDSLVQRELECLAEETDSLDGSSSASARGNMSDTSDSDQIIVDFLHLAQKRANANGTRIQRCPNRLARLVASRYPKGVRSQKRGSLRRNKQSRTCVSKPSSKPPPSTSTKGKRTALRRARAPRRPAPRSPAPRSPAPRRPAPRSPTPRRPAPRRPAPRRPAPRRPARSSERTDSDEPAHCSYAHPGRIVRPLRRRVNVTRSNKRKGRVAGYIKIVTFRNNGHTLAQDSSDNNNYTNFDNFEENLALPSTSTGYRGQSNSALFRIAEVDSDDDLSLSSRPISPRNQNMNGVPNNLINVVPTPINGSRDPLADSTRMERPEFERNSTTATESRLRMNLRRVRRNGRLSIQRSDSSESPPHIDQADRTSTVPDRLSPKVHYNRTVARLMNETNESELESSCSTEGSRWPVDKQRAKKPRRNYRNHMESDSN